MAIELEDTLHADGSLEMEADHLRVAAALQSKITAPMAVAEEGALVGTRAALNFIGAGVSAVDNAVDDRIDVTVASPLAADITSEAWAAPATPHALNQEFDSTILPANYQLWQVELSDSVAGTIGSGVDLFSQPPVNTMRIDANRSGRRSWLLMQPRNEGKHWFYGVKITTPPDGQVHVYRSRISTSIVMGVVATNEAMVMFGMCCDVSGKPAFQSAGPMSRNGVWGGFGSAPNQLLLGFFGNTTSGATGGWGANIAGALPVDVEIFMIVKGSTALGYCPVTFFARSGSTVFRLADTGISILPNSAGWVGWLVYASATYPSSAGAIYRAAAADYIRREDGTAGLLF